MAVVKEITIKVNDSDLGALDQDLNKLSKSFDKVEGEAKKASNALEDVSDNGGAIAILDELTGGLATKFRDATEASKLFGSVTRKQLIATGIGAFVVALGLIAAYWDDIIDLITGANDELEKQKQLNDDINKQLERQLEIRSLEETFQRRQEQVAVLRAKLAGKSEAEITAIRRKGFEDRIAIAQQEVNEANKILLQTADADVEAYNKAVEAQERAFERLSSAQFALQIFDLENQLANRGRGGGETRNETEIGALSLSQEAEIMNAQIVADAVIGIKENQFSREQALEMTRLAFKKEIQMQEADILMQFGGLLQQLDKESKGLAVAGIIAEQIGSAAKVVLATTEANAKAVAASPLTFGQPWVTLNTISAGLGIASGVAAATQAISALGGGGSASRPSLGTGNQGAPSFNVVGSSGVNQLAQSLQQEQEPIQAYVVANNVTTAQSLTNNIVETAAIG